MRVLAPPFTRENAGDYARRATIAREANRAAKRAARNPSKDFNALNRAAKQVERILDWMDELGNSQKDKQQFIALSGCLDRLWNKAFPTQGAVKVRSGSRQDRPAIAPLVPVTPPENPPPNPPKNG